MPPKRLQASQAPVPESPTPVPQELPQNPTTPTNSRDVFDQDPLGNPFIEESSPNLAQAIMLMTNELRR
jgi:hypothetical protein